MSELVEQLEKNVKCPLDKKHKMKVKSLSKDKKKFVMWCPDCQEQFGIAHEIKGGITKK